VPGRVPLRSDQGYNSGRQIHARGGCVETLRNGTIGMEFNFLVAASSLHLPAWMALQHTPGTVPSIGYRAFCHGLHFRCKRT